MKKWVKGIREEDGRREGWKRDGGKRVKEKDERK